MRDIKVKRNIKTNKIVEKKFTPKVDTFRSSQSTAPKSKYKTSALSTILFAFMSMSVFVYVFFVSSSVFYAVKEGQSIFKAESITNVTSADEVDPIRMNFKKEKISYINKETDLNITLK